MILYIIAEPLSKYHRSRNDSKCTWFVVSGDKPSYAVACKNIQEYATACLCTGTKPSNVRPNPKLKIVESVSSESTVTTLSLITTTTATPTVTETATRLRVQRKPFFCSTTPFYSSNPSSSLLSLLLSWVFNRPTLMSSYDSPWTYRSSS